MVKVVDAKRDEDQVDEYHGTKVGNRPTLVDLLKKIYILQQKWSTFAIDIKYENFTDSRSLPLDGRP